MSYNLESYQQPFWAKSGNFVRGRDPLGVQNSSISVYASLLPGLTNLTLRLRYYGMYLWLLDQYDKLPETNAFKKDQQGQYTFIRRAELILAFVMINKYPNEQSVIGSQYVSENLNEIKEKGFYNIALGADKHKETPKGSVYWDYTSGALGQYYAGSLIALNLIQITSGYFHRTENDGKALAEAYNKSIAMNTAQLFLQRIKEGKLYQVDIDLLDEIALNKEYKNTPEGDFYMNMLLSNDGPKSKKADQHLPSQRKESLKLFLSLLHETDDTKSWLTLPQTSYQTCLTKTKDEVQEATFGWYYYYLNELAHHSLEAIFWGFLVEMDKGSYSLQKFIKHITSSVIKVASNNIAGIEKMPLKDVLKELDLETNKTLDFIDKIDASVKSNESTRGITEGIFAFLCLYRDNQHKLHEARAYAMNHFLHKKRGNALEVFQTYIESCKPVTFKIFVQKLVQTLLNEHIAIAYNKMGNGTKNLLKFIIEDNYLVHIETMKPNFTNPRLKTLHNFTQDLSLINDKDELTDAGQALLEKLSA
jgi:hypothetical protein